MENQVKPVLDHIALLKEMATFASKLDEVPREFVEAGVTIHLSARIFMKDGVATVKVENSTEFSNKAIDVLFKRYEEEEKTK